MNKNKWPKVSVITPTLNAERALDLCFSSIKDQDYKGIIEIVVADGGSTDKTLEIAKKHNAKIVKNKLKTGEAGKAVGVHHATGEILAFIDSDNVLPDEKWMSKMIEPFLLDGKIVCSEPIYYTYRKKDHWLTRYFALLGMGDPLNLFVGNYDRYSFISNKWTGLRLKEKNKKYGKEITLENEIPTIGANGFLIRKKELLKYDFGKYLFDIDVLKYLLKSGPLKIAKVKTGVVHLFSGNIQTFIRKQKRRIRDFLYFKKKGKREWQTNVLKSVIGILKFVLSTVLVIPLFVQAGIGYSRKPDIAWLFHPMACIITFFVYSFETIRSFFKTEEFDRKKWSQ